MFTLHVYTAVLLNVSNLIRFLTFGGGELIYGTRISIPNGNRKTDVMYVKKCYNITLNRCSLAKNKKKYKQILIFFFKIKKYFFFLLNT